MDFMRKNFFRTAALRVIETIVDLKKEKLEGESGTQQMTSFLLNESLTPYLDCARKCLKYISDGLLCHKLWKSGLVKGPSNFDYWLLFELQKEQASLRFG